MSDYPFPPDEFDTRAKAGAPIGVHRPQRSTWSRIWPAIASTFAIAAFLGVLWLALDHMNSGEGAAVIVTEGVGLADVVDTPSPEPDDAVAAEPDLAANVLVLNDGAPSGSAGRGKDTLVEHGFTTVEADTATQHADHQMTHVLFAPGNEATARAVAEILHIPSTDIFEGEIAPNDVVVVVRSALYLGE